MPTGERISRSMIIIVVAVLLVSGLTLGNGFVWDDLVFIVDNPFFTEFSPRKLLVPFSAGGFFEYFPVRELTLMLDYRLWGWAPFGFHLSNVLLYLCNVLSVYFLSVEALFLLADKRQGAAGTPPATTALLTAIFFAVHPIHSEVVSAVFNRGALLCGLFFFLGSLCYLRWLRQDSGHYGLYVGALLSFVLALFSKQYGIVLPIVLLFACVLHRTGARRACLSLAPFFALAGGFFFFFKAVAARGKILQDDLLVGASANLSSVIAKSVQIPFFYLVKLFWPVGHTPVYDVSFSPRLLSVPVLAAAALYLVLIVLAVSCRKKWPEPLFGLGWFFITLLPVLNLFNTSPVVSDRYAFLPSFGICFLAAAVTTRGAAAGRSRVVLPLAAAALLLLAGRSIVQNRVWHDSVSLWSAAIKVSPNLSTVYTSLGEAYCRNKDYDTALRYLRQAQQIDPTDLDAIYNEGLVHVVRGDVQSGIQTFKRALAFKKDGIETNFFLAEAYERLGNYDQALYHYNQALYSQARDLLQLKGRARLCVSRLVAAMPKLAALKEQAVRDAANPAPLAQLAITLDSLGLYDEALAAYAELERRGEGRWQLYYNMANVYVRLNRRSDAVVYYRKCIAVNPGYADAWNNLGLVYDRGGDYGEAVSAFRRAIDIDPRYAYPYYNLAKTYYKMGDRANALSYFTRAREISQDLAPLVDQFFKKLQPAEHPPRG